MLSAVSWLLRSGNTKYDPYCDRLTTHFTAVRCDQYGMGIATYMWANNDAGTTYPYTNSTPSNLGG